MHAVWKCVIMLRLRYRLLQNIIWLTNVASAVCFALTNKSKSHQNVWHNRHQYMACCPIVTGKYHLCSTVKPNTVDNNYTFYIGKFCNVFWHMYPRVNRRDPRTVLWFNILISNRATNILQSCSLKQCSGGHRMIRESEHEYNTTQLFYHTLSGSDASSI